jgi:hypothetical protein
MSRTRAHKCGSTQVQTRAQEKLKRAELKQHYSPKLISYTPLATLSCWKKNRYQVYGYKLAYILDDRDKKIDVTKYVLTCYLLYDL